jgi:hypothetical protein
VSPTWPPGILDWLEGWHRSRSEQFAVAHEAFALQEPEGPAWRQGIVRRHQKANGDCGFATRGKFVHPVQRDLATPRQHVSVRRLIAEVEKAPVARDERPAPSALLRSQQPKARPKFVHPLTVSSSRLSASVPAYLAPPLGRGYAAGLTLSALRKEQT